MNVVIYRTCDRPLYTERTFPRLVEATSAATAILMMENSGDKANIQKNRDTFESVADDRCEIVVAGKRLGITRPLINGIEYFIRNHKRPQHVFSVDDDIMVPEPQEVTWDQLLSAMLNGPWDVAGLFRHVRKTGKKRGEDLAAGYTGSIMAAGCAGFRYSIYEKDPIKDRGIAEFNIWSSKYKCGWSAQEGFFYQEIDKYAPEGQSLRYADYKEYSEHIDRMRDKLRGKK